MTTILPYILLGTGILSLLYFGRIVRYCGYPPDFSWFWTVGGAAFIIMAVFFKILAIFHETAGFILCLLVLLAGGFGLLFFYMFYTVLKKEGNKPAKDGAEYVIVLGAKVNGTVPSKALRARIHKAYDYLVKNKDAKAILTGGKGRGEDICESHAMEQELISLGIEKERLLIENESKSTIENIAFAAKMIPNRDVFVVIATSDFHALRGKTIAMEAGFKKIETLGAESSKVMALHYYTRETLSWILYRIKRIGKNRGRTGEKHE